MNNVKEFDRGVCYTFFNSYLEQAKEIQKQLGYEIAYEFFIAITEYALYQKEHENPMVRMLYIGLKDTIDANQNRREKGFSKADIETTKQILQYRADHPSATQRDIAKALDCSLGKVNSALKSNNANVNDNSNSNLNTNNNGVNVNMNTSPSQYRALEELTDEELNSIKKDFSNRVSYLTTKERLKLNRPVTKELQEEVDKLLSQRQSQTKNNKIIQDYASVLDADVVAIAEYLRCEPTEVLDNLIYIGVDAHYFTAWLAEDSHAENFSIDGDVWLERDEFNSYLDFVKMAVNANPIGVIQSYW